MAALNIGIAGGIGARSTSAPVITAITPGIAGLAHVDRRDAAVGDRRADVGDVGRALVGHIVHVGATGGQELGSSRRRTRLPRMLMDRDASTSPQN